MRKFYVVARGGDVGFNAHGLLLEWGAVIKNDFDFNNLRLTTRGADIPEAQVRTRERQSLYVCICVWVLVCNVNIVGGGTGDTL